MYCQSNKVVLYSMDIDNKFINEIYYHKSTWHISHINNKVLQWISNKNLPVCCQCCAVDRWQAGHPLKRIFVARSPALSDAVPGRPEHLANCSASKQNTVAPSDKGFVSFRRCFYCDILQPRDCTVISWVKPKQITIKSG